jgi:phage terminase small subunit
MGRWTKEKEDFCIDYIKTGEVTGAYIRSHTDNGLDKGIAKKSIQNRASRLLSNPDVQERIQEMKGISTRISELSLAEHLKTLARLRDEAAAAQQYGAAVNAETKRGQAAGLYVVKEQKDVKADISISWER